MSRKPKPQPTRCYDCKEAYLMRRSSRNPVVALCAHGEKRNVATTVFVCPQFQPSVTAPPVIHPMIDAK